MTTQRILVGDVRDRLRSLPDRSVHCVVTSPPYFGLRDYGTGTWDGGDPECDHLGEPFRTKANINANWDNSNDVKNAADRQPMGQMCSKCGATRIDQQIGLEPTLAEYVATMVDVFREVWRVLRDDGTLWLNLGDSYAGSSQTGGSGKETITGGKTNQQITMHSHKRVLSDGLKPKDLMGVPWRVVFALQDDGWYLRSDVIWHKPNPMPESVTDRPTKSHEYLFLLTKQPRYFYDHEAVREPMKEVSLKRLSQPNVLNQPGGPKDPKTGNRSHKKAINNQAERLIKHEKWATRFEGWDEYDRSLGRNARTVWTIPTTPFPQAHFATFPPALVEPCIKAGTSEKGVCPTCGAPWRRLVERVKGVQDAERPKATALHQTGMSDNGTKGSTLSLSSGSAGWLERGSKTIPIGWEQSCKCPEHVPIPATVLDPFVGSGTTLMVANQLGRNGIGIELNPEYAQMAADRIRRDDALFVDITVEDA